MVPIPTLEPVSHDGRQVFAGTWGNGHLGKFSEGGIVLKTENAGRTHVLTCHVGDMKEH